MRKFLSLFVIAAMLAFAGAAIAGDAATFKTAVTEVGALYVQGEAINGEPDKTTESFSVKAYYYGTVPTDATVGVKMITTQVCQHGNIVGGFIGASGSETWKLGGNVNRPSGPSALDGDVNFADLDLTDPNGLVIRKLSVFTPGASDPEDPTYAAASSAAIDMTIVPTEVKFSITSADKAFPTLTIYNTATGDIVGMALGNDQGQTITYEELAVAVVKPNGSVETTAPAPNATLAVPDLGEVKVENSGAITVTPSGAKIGTYKLAIVTKADTTAKIGDLKIAGLAGSGVTADEKLAEFTVVVTATPPTPGPSPSPTPSPTPDPTPDPTPEQGDVGDTPIAGGDIDTNADIPQEITSVEVVSTNQRPTAGGKVDDLFRFDGQEAITGGMSSVISGGGNITAINIVSTIRLDIEKTSTGGSAAFPLTIRNFDRVPTTGMTFVVLVWPKNRPGANAYDQFPASVSGGVLTANITNVGDYFSENDIIIAEVAKNASGGGSSGCDAGAAALVALVGLVMLKRRAR